MSTPDQPPGASIEERMVEQVDRLSEVLIERNAEIKRLREALLAIAEGNLGGDPWEADYRRIREFASKALGGDRG